MLWLLKGNFYDDSKSFPFDTKELESDASLVEDDEVNLIEADNIQGKKRTEQQGRRFRCDRAPFHRFVFRKDDNWVCMDMYVEKKW